MLLTLGRGLSGVHAKKAGLLTLSDVVASCVFDVDATIKQSYDGTTPLWRNLIKQPADGAQQDDYNFVHNPILMTFEGQAGHHDAYFLGTSATSSIASFALDSNTTFLKNLLLTNGGDTRPFSLALAFHTPPDTAAMAANAFGANAAITVLSKFRIQSTSTGTLRILFTGDTSTTERAGPSHSTTADAPYVYIVSIDKNGACQAWLNGHKLSANINLPDCTSQMLASLSILRSTSTNARLYSASFYNAVLNDEQAEAIRAAYSARHKREYT